MAKDEKKGKNRRVLERRGGISRAWAILALEDQTQLHCWVLDESAGGVGLETREQRFPCPVEVGATYWMHLKPSSAKSASWVAGTVRHIRERGVGTGIYKIGIKIISTPPRALGKAPGLEV